MKITEVDKMAKEKQTDLIVLTGEDGKEFEVEVVDRVEANDNEYYIVRPVDDPEIVTVLKVDFDENGDEVFATIEDEDEFNDVEEAYNLMYEDEE